MELIYVTIGILLAIIWWAFWPDVYRFYLWIRSKNKKPQYVIIQTKCHPFDRFFTVNDGTINDELYKIIGYAETVEEAQTRLYGKSYAKT